jgi:membrane protein
VTAPQDGLPGKDAKRPSQFAAADWRAIAGRLWAQTFRIHLPIVAAGVAFFSVLALFPAIAALVGLYGLVADPADISAHLAGLHGVVPENALDIIEGQVTNIAATSTGALGTASAFALLVALWSARAGVSALIEGLNIVYGEPEPRGILANAAVSLALTVLCVLMAIVALAAIVVLPALLNRLPLGALAEWAARLLRWPILLGATVLTIGALYRYGPNRATARVPWVTRGAVAATLLWLVASFGFSLYVTEFGNYNEVYGSLGAAVILLLWVFISAFLVLLGAELNAEMELHTRRDTTTGPEKPMGDRGAYVADHAT